MRNGCNFFPKDYHSFLSTPKNTGRHRKDLRMLCDDQDTFHALNLLESTVQQGDRPLVIWLGAGVGAWAGYPLWKELATKMHSRFSREAAHYDKTTASSLLNQAAYPRLFQLMRESDDTFYFNLLQNEFVPKQPRPVYRRLLRVLNRIVPTFVLTTNVDEVLEQNLAGRQIVQCSDVERIPQLLFGRIGFVGKLHGSISSMVPRRNRCTLSGTGS